MGAIEDHKKFKQSSEQKNPLNPDGVKKEDISLSHIAIKTIKDNTSKK